MSVTIKDVQLALIARGYDVGPDGADGRGGTNTKKALRAFQLDNFLPDSGKVDQFTLRLLFPEAFPPQKERKTVMNNILGGLFQGLLGNLLNWQLVQGYIRSALVAFGGAIGLNGFVGDDGANTIIGAVMVIAGVIFSALSNNTKVKALDVVKAVDAAPDVMVVPAAKSPTTKPIVKTQ